MQRVRGAGFWLVAFAFAFALWMVHDDSVKTPELLAGIGVAALAASGTELVRRQRVAGISIRAAYLRRAWRLGPSAARDCVSLSRLAIAQLLRPQPARGRTVALPFEHRADDPPDNGRLALAEALGSFAPGTIVIGVDPDRDVVIAHQLGASDDPAALDPLGLG